MENANDNGIPYNYMNLAGIYRGEIENGVPHGLGDYTYIDEDDATNNIRINGTWQNGVLISGTRYQGDAGDECVFTGFFHANGQVREGTMTFRGGVEFHGTFHEDGDFKHGRMTNLGIDGNGWYEGDFVNGVRNGTGELHNDGVVFTGTWKDDFLHGKGTMVLPNGTRYDGMWNDHHFDGSIFYSNGVRREFIGHLQYIGGKAVGYSEEMSVGHGEDMLVGHGEDMLVGHSEDMSVTNSDHHLTYEVTYEGDFEDNMPMHFGSVAWFGEFFNVRLPVFSHAFTSFCIVSPDQYTQLSKAGVIQRHKDAFTLEYIDSIMTEHLLHFRLKLDETETIKLWHPVKPVVVGGRNIHACPYCRLKYPQPLIDWIKPDVQMNAAIKIQRLVRARTRTKKRVSAATKIQRFVRSRTQKRKSHGGTKRKIKRTAKRCC